MSHFVQKRYEEAILTLRSVPFYYTNYTWDYRGWSSTPRILLHTRHYDVLNSLYYFFVTNGYDNWNEQDFRDHMKKVAFEKSYRGWSYKPFDFAHKEKKSRWPKTQYYYRQKRSYVHNPKTKKKEKREPRWSDRKRTWKREHSQSGWKKCMKDTTNRSLRAESRKMMHSERYDDMVTKHKKHHYYDYW